MKKQRIVTLIGLPFVMLVTMGIIDCSETKGHTNSGGGSQCIASVSNDDGSVDNITIPNCPVDESVSDSNNTSNGEEEVIE